MHIFPVSVTAALWYDLSRRCLKRVQAWDSTPTSKSCCIWTGLSKNTSGGLGRRGLCMEAMTCFALKCGMPYTQDPLGTPLTIYCETLPSACNCSCRLETRSAPIQVAYVEFRTSGGNGLIASNPTTTTSNAGSRIRPTGTAAGVVLLCCYYHHRC